MTFRSIKNHHWQGYFYSNFLSHRFAAKVDQVAGTKFIAYTGRVNKTPSRFIVHRNVSWFIIVTSWGQFETIKRGRKEAVQKWFSEERKEKKENRQFGVAKKI